MNNTDQSGSEGYEIMDGFFAFYDVLDPEAAFPLWGVRHMTMIAIMLLGLSWALKWVGQLPEEKSWRVIQVAAVVEPLLELWHTVWLYSCGQTQLVKLLPLHLCSMQCIFIPLAIFSKKRVLWDYLYATAVLGGLCGVIFPAGVADVYPLWHFQSLQTVLLHSLLVFIPLALIVTGRYEPSVRRFPQALLVFLPVAAAAALVDVCFGENYMFILYPPEGTPLVWLYATFGHGGYLLLTFLLIVMMSFSIHLPFWYRQKKQLPVEKPSIAG